MLIAIDRTIPDGLELFGAFGDVRTFDGRKVTAADVAEADALVVRSVTCVDRALLAGSKVRFVGTVTSGTDHVDCVWLADRGIHFVAAEGCNSRPVAEYVLTAILLLASRKSFNPREMTLGVVGLGRIGSLVADWASAFGMNVLRCDPPLQRSLGGEGWVDSAKLLSESDLITLHVPLTKSGPDKTHEMIDADWLSSMKSGSILINTSRGRVVCESALLSVLNNGGRLKGAILDVWRNEPRINGELVSLCDLATPHVAGYSYEARRRGVAMVLAALVQWLDIGAESIIKQTEKEQPHLRFLRASPSARDDKNVTSYMDDLVDLVAPMASACDLQKMDVSLRSAVVEDRVSDSFDQLRIPFWSRHEFGSYQLNCGRFTPADEAFLANMGFRFPV